MTKKLETTAAVDWFVLGSVKSSDSLVGKKKIENIIMWWELVKDSATELFNKICNVWKHLTQANPVVPLSQKHVLT